MATVAVRHHVKDFNTWRAAYDAHGTVRQQLGCTGDTVLREEQDANQVLIITEWPTLDAAHAFVSDPELPEVMKRAGVEGAPRIEVYA